MTNNQFKKQIMDETTILKENLKIIKLRAEIAKHLYEEAYYMLQYTKIKESNPELFNGVVQNDSPSQETSSPSEPVKIINHHEENKTTIDSIN